MIAGYGASGKIITIGSIYSIFGLPEFSAHTSAKTGLLGLTSALAAEVAADDIQVNIWPPSWQERLDGFPQIS